MNNILHISKQINYQNIDDYLISIYTEDIDTLSIVKKLSSFKFALYPMVLQTISTLFFRHPKTKVLIKSLENDNIDDLAKELIYLTSIMRANVLINDHKEEFQKNYVYKAKLFLDNMNRLESISNTFKGIGVQLICFDWSKNYAYLNTLYNGDKLITKNQFITSLAPKLFKYSMSQAPTWKKTKEKLEGDFANIIYELFENTELHAKDNSLTKKSIRGLRIKYTKLHDSENKDKYNDINDYLNTFENQEYMEISIFDSGNGLAQSLSPREEFDFEVEKKLVLKCFNKHTSRTGLPTRGLGLFLVMEMIKKHKGLFVLRTGRTLLKADYSNINLNNTNILDEQYIRECQKIIGTSYTIILPLIYKVKSHV